LEGDGVLLSVVFDAASRVSFLLVLNAQDLTEHARLPLPFCIPKMIHGLFVPEDGKETFPMDAGALQKESTRQLHINAHQSADLSRINASQPGSCAAPRSARSTSFGI
jgi:hypothetical protein